jgi:hypothetical protein
MKPTLLNNILPHDTNQRIITQLSNHHWFLAWDTKMDRLKKVFSNKNSGFSIITFDRGQPQTDTVLNVYGEMIFHLIIQGLQTKGTLERLYWNMYFKNSQSESHTDRPSDEFRIIFSACFYR